MSAFFPCFFLFFFTIHSRYTINIQYILGPGSAPPGGRLSVCFLRPVLPGALLYKFSSIWSLYIHIYSPSRMSLLICFLTLCICKNIVMASFCWVTDPYILSIFILEFIQSFFLTGWQCSKICNWVSYSLHWNMHFRLPLFIFLKFIFAEYVLERRANKRFISSWQNWPFVIYSCVLNLS